LCQELRKRIISYFPIDQKACPVDICMGKRYSERGKYVLKDDPIIFFAFRTAQRTFGGFEKLHETFPNVIFGILLIFVLREKTTNPANLCSIRKMVNYIKLCHYFHTLVTL
jgi:hypothetical protein